MSGYRERTGGDAGDAVVQGTVKDFDADSRGGAVYLDDGTELSFDAAAFDRGGLRLLRSGQRVRLRTHDGHVTAVTLVTFELPPA